MAYFAKLDKNNIVTKVTPVSNDDIKENGVEKESKGIAFCKNLYGQDTVWIQTSYNWRIRKQFASSGYFYDSEKDKFIAPHCYPSWSLDENDDWQPPVALPQGEGVAYHWDEDSTSWEKVE